MAEGNLIVTTNNLNNSNKARREQEEAEHKDLPAVSSEKKRVAARPKKESFWSKCKTSFFGGRTMGEVIEDSIFDVAIPAIKATISDLFSNSIEVLLFGESRGRRSRRDGYTDYARVSRSDRDRAYSSVGSRDHDRYVSYRDITFDSKVDAKECLSEVFDYLNDYGRISEAVYISILNRYLDNPIRTTWEHDRKGWYKEDLAGCTEPRRTREGWEIDFPRAGKI